MVYDAPLTLRILLMVITGASSFTGVTVTCMTRGSLCLRTSVSFATSVKLSPIVSLPSWTYDMNACSTCAVNKYRYIYSSAQKS